MPTKQEFEPDFVKFNRISLLAFDHVDFDGTRFSSIDDHVVLFEDELREVSKAISDCSHELYREKPGDFLSPARAAIETIDPLVLRSGLGNHPPNIIRAVGNLEAAATLLRAHVS
jgi:hypothetical protein